jgi:hypothetical protein
MRERSTRAARPPGEAAGLAEGGAAPTKAWSRPEPNLQPGSSAWNPAQQPGARSMGEGRGGSEVDRL